MYVWYIFVYVCVYVYIHTYINDYSKTIQNIWDSNDQNPVDGQRYVWAWVRTYEHVGVYYIYNILPIFFFKQDASYNVLVAGEIWRVCI